jgi:hypothetical protein
VKDHSVLRISRLRKHLGDGLDNVELRVFSSGQFTSVGMVYVAHNEVLGLNLENAGKGYALKSDHCWKVKWQTHVRAELNVPIP